MTKGWKLENVRHSLARKGIKTGRKKIAKPTQWGIIFRPPTFYFRSVAGKILWMQGETHSSSPFVSLYNLFSKNSNFPCRRPVKEAKGEGILSGWGVEGTFSKGSGSGHSLQQKRRRKRWSPSRWKKKRKGNNWRNWSHSAPKFFQWTKSLRG